MKFTEFYLVIVMTFDKFGSKYMLIMPFTDVFCQLTSN